MKLFIVRHGLSRSNRLATYSEPGTPLAEEAKALLQPVKAYLKTKQFDRVYASDYKRAMDTARILGFPDPVKEARLRERNFGVFIGKNHEECSRELGDAYRAFLEDPLSYRIPEGESFDDVCDRVWSFLDEISEQERKAETQVVGFRPQAASSEQVLIVCHFNVMCACLCWIFENRHLGPHLVTENGGILQIEVAGPLKTLHIECFKN